MKIAIVGMGRVGSSIAFALITGMGSQLTRLDIHDIKRRECIGEGRDLREAALLYKHKTDIMFHISYPEYDYCIICAGSSRKPYKYEDDNSLFIKNQYLIRNIITTIKAGEYLIVTNPPELLAKAMGEFTDSKITPIGAELDKVREELKFPSSRHILNMKGYTNWGVAAEVLEYLRSKVCAI